MRVCPSCKRADELYRILTNVTITEDIFIDGLINGVDEAYVDYTVSEPNVTDDIGDMVEDEVVYRCSYCQHTYEGKSVDSIYFNEMIEKEK
jgi:aspartate carbamoyltransferase regulatory subunit